ncbi:glycosyltransferase family 2 protein [Bacillus sp. FJAT-49732]|uniref:Glycosyltransferase family 2 protein n=1 Tax=Lederbergia citrisecunda TaxID=2833583 RepID=A0A942YMM0_9BACI|nr:glycosyltransferase [Lederbergia citrisecunda]MBS4201619.1 glycosyltransferase family 2 protein [Lederbergia citrisecunda]
MKSPNHQPYGSTHRNSRFYLKVNTKFWLSHSVALLWMCISIYLAKPWLIDLSTIISLPLAFLVIAGISYIPGYMNAFLVASLIMDKQPVLKDENPNDAITLLIAAYNEEDKIYNTLSYIGKQDYRGPIQVILINNGSTDQTVETALKAKEDFQLKMDILHEKKPGKFHALNLGLLHVKTPYLITLDADTLLHQSAIRYLVARIKSSPADVSAVAGSILVKNSRDNMLTKIQEWDYFLGIASIKRLQGLYQGTLVAQGAYSLYKTESIREINGWPDAIGEDIVLTWKLLEKRWKIYFEPLAVAFTEVPSSLTHFFHQRSRWARGMIEGLKQVKPWQQPQIYTKYLTSINLIMPYLDIIYTFCWLPGLVLAFFGHYWIVGPMTLFVLPLTLLSYGILYVYQSKFVFKPLNLKVRKNIIGFIIFILAYQMIMSPTSVFGYVQELFKFRRKWK